MVKAVQIWVSGDQLLDPEGDLWRGIAKERIALQATPPILQPSEYVQNKWTSLPYGQTPEVRVAAAHNGKAIFFRLEWDDAVDDSHPNDMANFPDQCGVMLPIKDDAPIAEMGMPATPVNMWLWRADLETPHYVTAEGRGTTTRHPDAPLTGKGVWRNGVWQVVLSRPFNVSLPAAFVVPLAPGLKHKCTFAVWQGSNKERAGLKAYQPLWQPLEIEA
jgi:complex iron-sulfur molybdoenzyme family reductase subunit gamma